MKILRIAVVIIAITLAILFIRERHIAGNAHFTRYEHPVLTDHEWLGEWNKRRDVFLSEKLGTIFVEDRFRKGGMIRLDSLMRRVKQQYYMLSSSKSVVMRSFNPEEDYLDSLLAANYDQYILMDQERVQWNEREATELPPEWADILVEDRYALGGMITLDSLTRRVHDQHFHLHSTRELVMQIPSHRDEWRYLDSLLQHHSANKNDQ